MRSVWAEVERLAGELLGLGQGRVGGAAIALCRAGRSVYSQHYPSPPYTHYHPHRHTPTTTTHATHTPTYTHSPTHPPHAGPRSRRGWRRRTASGWSASPPGPSGPPRCATAATALLLFLLLLLPCSCCCLSHAALSAPGAHAAAVPAGLWPLKSALPLRSTLSPRLHMHAPMTPKQGRSGMRSSSTACTDYSNPKSP